MPLDIDQYRHHLAGFDLTEAQAADVIRSIHLAMESFVDLAFGTDATQILLGIGLAQDIFGDIWDRRLAGASAQKCTMQDELKRYRAVGDRVMGTDSETLIAAYEKRIRGVEERKTELRDKIARGGAPTRDFTTQFRTAMAFLANPAKLWISGNIAYRRIVLKLAFADQLRYARNEGF